MGRTITYDEIGNPLSYYNGSSYTFTWEQGRRLNSASKSGGAATYYTYDANGIRTSKTVSGMQHTYYLNGSQIVAEEFDGNLFVYMYDADGSPIGMQYRNTSYADGAFDVYWYEKNLQGDIVAIYNSTGVKVTTYSYDAWGNATISYPNNGLCTATLYNPFRYRGYYRDLDTGFYYLNSRYYDPATCRFLTMDDPGVLLATPTGLTDKNLFAYCDNNPVARVDNGGQFWDTVFDVISLGASIVEVCVNPTDPWAWAGLVGDAVDLIPFVTGVGEVTRAVKTIDKVADTVQIAKAVDFTDDAADIVKTLDRSSGFTKSTASAGRKIHQGYKVGDGFNPNFKEFPRNRGVRPDYIDFDNKIIYELKPMNRRGVRSGIRQLQKYNKAFGGGFTLRLELY